MSMVDHFTASRQFLTHQERERKCGRETPAQWSWVVPPVSGSNCPLWHHEVSVFNGGVWWCVVVCGGVWWCVVVCGGVWWCGDIPTLLIILIIFNSIFFVI